MIAYEQIRKPRVEKVVAATRENGEIFHLVDETEQNLRNEAMMTGSLYIKGVEGDEPETGERRTLQKELSSGQLHAWIFKFDAIADVSIIPIISTISVKLIDVNRHAHNWTG